MSMVKAYVARDTMQAQFVRDLLGRQGVRAVVLGNELQLAIGGVPAVANALPSVWVHPDDQPLARELITRMESGADRQQLAAGAPWRCAKCGETIEPQFTDCWNCGTPRWPERAVVPDDRPPTQVDLDIPCVSCGYNLRGLPPTGYCPECGLSIFPSLRAYADSLPPGFSNPVKELLRAATPPPP